MANTVPTFHAFYNPATTIVLVAGRTVHREPGWYAQSLTGTTCFGPFDDPVECAAAVRDFCVALAQEKEDRDG